MEATKNINILHDYVTSECIYNTINIFTLLKEKCMHRCFTRSNESAHKLFYFN